jgi:hypothetical protein
MAELQPAVIDVKPAAALEIQSGLGPAAASGDSRTSTT